MSRLHELKVTGELPPLNYQGKKNKGKKFFLWGNIGFVGFIKNRIHEALQARKIRAQEHKQATRKGIPIEESKIRGGWRMKKLD